MDEFDKDGARLLDSLRDFTPAPGGRVDPGLAVRTGRRRAKLRTAMGTGAAVAAVLAAVAGSTLLGRAVEPAAERPAGPVEATFDPSKPAFTVGRAGGFKLSRFTPGRYAQGIIFGPEKQGGSLRADAYAEIYAKGHLPRGAAGPPSGAAAPLVHGHRAYWLVPPVLRPGAVELAWEWSPGAWAYVTINGKDADRDRAHRLALSILPAGAQP